MRASQHQRIYTAILAEQCIHILTHEIISTLAICLMVLDYRNPHRTRLRHRREIRIQLLYLHIVAAAAHRSVSTHHTHHACTAPVAESLHRRAYHTKHAARSIYPWQIILLDSTQSLSRRRITGKYHQAATMLKQKIHSLERKSVHHVKRPRTIRCTRIISQIYIIILRQNSAQLAQYRQTTIARIEHTYSSAIR